MTSGPAAILDSGRSLTSEYTPGLTRTGGPVRIRLPCPDEPQAAPQCIMRLVVGPCDSDDDGPSILESITLKGAKSGGKISRS